MGLFRRRQKPEPPTPSPELAALVERLAVPCVRMALGGGPPTTATATSVAAYPYLPDDRAWPVWEDEPMFPLLQVDFAEVPPLAGFPTRGVLQWFVGADDTLGLTFDETSGTVGFEVRWYADPVAPSRHRPEDPTPWHEADAASGDVFAAIGVETPTALVLAPGRAVPLYAEVAGRVDHAVLAEWAAAVGEDPGDPAFVWDEFVRGGSSPFAGLGTGSTIGGAADFTQDDPRGHGAFPAADAPAGRLLVQLDADQLGGGWGDHGIGHLFGDPAALAEGDLSSLRYHWDCT